MKERHRGQQSGAMFEGKVVVTLAKADGNKIHPDFQ